MPYHAKPATKALKVPKKSTASHTCGPERSQSTNPTIDNTLFLQRNLGNQTVQRMMKTWYFQTKRIIGHPEGIYLKEAGHIADRAIRMSGPLTRQQSKVKLGGKPIQGKPLTHQINPIIQKEKKDEEGVQTKPLHSRIAPFVQRQAEDEGKLIYTKKTGGLSYSNSPDLEADMNAMKGCGTPLPRQTQSFFESRFGSDFGSVRIHTGTRSIRMNKQLNAQAFTYGRDIHFNEGRYDSNSTKGKRLLAHELMHSIQQKAGVKRIQLSPDLSDEAIRLETAANKLLHKPGSLDLIQAPPSKPRGGRRLRRWKQRIDVKKVLDAYRIALKIMALAPKAGVDLQKHNDIEERAEMIAENLAKLGFIEEAMDIADRIGKNIPATVTKKKKREEFKKKDIELIGFIYKPILDKLDKISITQLKKITDFYSKAQKSLLKNPVATKLTEGKCEFARKKLGIKKTKLVLDILIDNYKKKDKEELITNISRVLIFYKGFRQPFSRFMWTKDKSFLFDILSSKFFVEPGYGPSVIAVSGKTYPLTMKRDVPWVYTWKQAYYVHYLIELCKKAKIKDKTIVVPKDPRLIRKSRYRIHRKRNYRKIIRWLERNTENIAKAIKVLYPTQPNKVIDIYGKIADIFFYHVSGRNIRPNRFGRLLRRYGRGKPGMRIRVDCDVLAAYAARLLKTAGFKPIGYIIIEPCNIKLAAHASLLLKKGTNYYVVDNKDMSRISAKTLPDAQNQLEQKALKAYSPGIKYASLFTPAGPKGEIPLGFYKGVPNRKQICSGTSP